MQLNKFINITIILIFFSGLTVFEIYRKSDKAILHIKNAAEIDVDLNGNNIFDSGETICIPDVQVFTSDLTKSQTDLLKNTNITFEDGIKIGYLTDIFAENILSDKRVKLKYNGQQDQNCKYADIIINKDSYRQKLINSGFGITNNKVTDNFNLQLTKAKKLKLVILNHKSSKYHKLNCKYGLIAHDSVIIPEREIPQDSKPCKYCHLEPKVKNTNKKINLSYPTVISNGNIKMFLTDLTTTLKPVNKCNSLVCKELLDNINSSKKSIDIALYGWDNVPEIYNALVSAKNRGVKIQIAYDISKNNYYPNTQKLLDLADKSSGDTPKILMHNKFIIFDDKRILTGSMNFSPTGLSGFNSNCIFFIDSNEIAGIYKQEFQQMIDGKFHQEKSKVNHKTVLLNDTRITPLFSPKDKVIVNSIIPLINNAKSYIYIPAFILTHDELANALINAYKRKVDIKIIVDATNVTASRSKIKLLRQSGIPVKVENYAGKMHSKSIIIDDKYIIAGSMNFSNSGENKNDENCLIIENARLTKYYRGFFEYLWKKIPEKYLKQNVRAEGKYSIGSCSDGIDNNYNGKIDMEDDACKP